MRLASRIKQVITNLIDNAVKFTPEYGTIKVEIQNNSNTVKIVVTDSGIGISSENIPKLFKPFFQVQRNAARKQRGTGLGLVVSMGFVS